MRHDASDGTTPCAQCRRPTGHSTPCSCGLVTPDDAPTAGRRPCRDAFAAGQLPEYQSQSPEPRSARPGAPSARARARQSQSALLGSDPRPDVWPVSSTVRARARHQSTTRPSGLEAQGPYDHAAAVRPFSLVKHGAPANCHAHARGKANAFTPMDDGRATKLFHKRYDTLVMPRKLHSSSYRVTSVFSRRGQLYRLHHKTHRLHPHSLQYYGDVWLVAIPCHVTLTAVTSCLVFAYSLCPLY
jgi:hypothetical protein